jgi:hypothetical protein
VIIRVQSLSLDLLSMLLLLSLHAQLKGSDSRRMTLRSIIGDAKQTWATVSNPLRKKNHMLAKCGKSNGKCGDNNGRNGKLTIFDNW